METFAEELRNLVERWREDLGTTDGEIINVLMDEIDRLGYINDD
jgi:hypothetical protein